MFPDGELTRNAFLGGAIEALQPTKGYRAGVDAVLLAAAVPAVNGQSVLELGCGAGVASLCLARRVPNLRMTGVELQPDYVDLAHRNAAGNGIGMEVFAGDLRSLPKPVRARGFDHVLANPPYFQRSKGTAARDIGRDIALAGETPLADWVSAAAKRLKPKGYATFIQDIRRLPELLAEVSGRLGSVEILPLSARQSRAPHLVILRARKGGRADFKLHYPRVMHEGDHHDEDRESYSAEFSDILREAAPLTF